MIKGYCTTNLDDYQRIDWPECFSAVPRIGERVESLDRKTSLKVVGISHIMLTDRVFDEKKKVPGIKVELNR